jgi:protocatechuate 3,4-dioxygenase beta subunit
MTSHAPDTPPILGRRGLLAGLGAAGLAAAAQAAAPAAERLPLTAQTTEGPYYFDPGKVRADITEGLEGVPLQVQFTVCDAEGKPQRGMRVDIWHCDARGHYSGYAGQGDDRQLSMKDRTFLRGSLFTSADGVAAFMTIYPGWYAGRTTHIHFKVLHGARAVLTSQFFLPDALSEFLYTQLPDYQRARLRDTLNSTDGIALDAGQSVLGSVREDGAHYLATLTLVVDPAANPHVDRPPALGEGPQGQRESFGPGGPPRRGGEPGRARPGGPPSLEGSARTKALVPGVKVR